ncbi:extracellular solute-binding protein [Paenibacillus sp. N4]|uniref:ABC transporter substrate-binding protein n=1 Tax=Paenibacillus vietnamensis TaxID=2590547 RepID=UPI001CD07236|nr:extracellular solute-binding protein [Paenibacillus vietnamensis]MCA0757189.1 extracellular solute-binding protein [Paenibacillus vietnamensis]
MIVPRKMISTMLASIMLFTGLSACSSNTGSNGETGTSAAPQASSPETSAPPADSQPDELKGDLTWFGLASPDTFEEQYGQFLKQKFPKINFTYINQTEEQRLEQLIASGTQIDMYLTSAHDLRVQYMPANMALDLSPLIEKHGVDLSAIEPAYMDAVTVDGKPYLLPVSDNKFVMYYNKDMFDRFGVKYPWDGMTWDDALTLSKQITRNEGGKQYIGLWMSPKHYFRVAQNSAGLVDPETNKATVNNDQWKFIFDNIFYNFTRDPGFQQRANKEWLSHADFNKNFVVGMYIYQSGWMMSADTSLPENWDIAAVPTFKEYPDINTQTYATYAGISATSKQQDLAMEVLKYLISEEYQTLISKRGMITPLLSQAVRDAAFADYPFADSKNIQALYYGTPAKGRVMTQFDELVIEESFDADIVREIAKGKLDVNSALRRAEETANKLIQEQLTKQ